ncbi:MAG TPA: phosphoribosylglycinamide formyltransferase [Clostridia bacterium]|nr:phosphoribosylglycinamide formyltransferase [Clostridia bacterium]
MGIKIAVLASGGGTNLQAIIDATEKGLIQGEVSLILSNNEDAFALKRGENKNIPSFYVDSYNRNEKILKLLKAYDIDLVVLAGYLKILSEEIIDAFRNKIINIHPSLLPKYSGKGFYGEKVHQAVINNNEEYSGATIHYVDEGIDTGKILMQKKVKVLDTDDYISLSKRILKVEHEILVTVVEKLSKGDHDFESIN